MRDKFDRNVVIMTAALTVSFMIRNTSPIGWPPLLLMKILYEGSLVPILMAGTFVFAPLVALFIGLDSLYYGHFPVITAYNFVQANLTEGLSKYFGVHPTYYYFLLILPWYFLTAIPALYPAFWVYGRDAYTSGRKPYILVVTLTYLIVFSAIAHKEARFLLPIIPFCFLMLGYFLQKVIKSGKGKCFTRFFLVLIIVIEVAITIFYNTQHSMFFKIFEHLQAKEVAPHSLYCSLGQTSPMFSWTHRHTYLGPDG